ncbi:hypothetical protein QJQ45_025918 [Haematococcus lacustris]|nr:hypothetical protein QJQ45_025918 [Haematococcus lacustris]
MESQLRVLTAEEQQALEELLDANGLTEEQLESTEQITHLEMFLHEYPKMMCIHLFPYLKSLCLIHQGIREICNLECCVHLEKLWVVENEVTAIQGLERCSQLRELYLYSNRIRLIQGIQHLTALEVLWLGDNCISEIQGISSLCRLRDLNLARNDIVTVGDSLQHNTALEVLNLADNAIGSFKDVRPLARLPLLTHLCFADPMWGECPLASLCNYQTFVLFMLPKLSSLDTLLLAEETKLLAEATFLKKQMYYNMRIKTMYRNARNIIKLAGEGKKARGAERGQGAGREMRGRRIGRDSKGWEVWSQSRQALQGQLVQCQKALQREVQEATLYGPGPGRAEQQELNGYQDKLCRVDCLLDAFSAEAAEVDAHYEDCASRTYQVVDAHVGRMMLELETAGNIRLEEGKPSDLWFSSCSDLLLSRFNPSDYSPCLGVSGVSVLGVTRIHNRWLRNRFERQLLAVAQPADQSQKKAMEYLFLGEHPLLPSNLERCVEAGLPDPQALASLGLDAAVLLSNNLFLADQLRLQAVVEARSLAATAGAAGGADQAGAGAAAGAASSHLQAALKVEQPAVGRLMIVKVHLRRTTADTACVMASRFSATSPKLFGKDGRLSAAACLEGAKLGRGSVAEGVDAVHRSRSGDAKQRLWYIFDPLLVLPEYIVEFQYDLYPSSGSKLARVPRQPLPDPPAPAMGSSAAAGYGELAGGAGGKGGGARGVLMGLEAELSSSATQSILVGLDAELRPLARPLMAWLALHFDPSVAHRVAASSLEDHKVLELLQAAPQPPPRAKLDSMAAEALGRYLGDQQLSGLTYLNLHGCGLRKLEGLGLMPCLKTLCLSYNELVRLEGLSELTGLEHLDVAHNSLKKVDGLKGLGRLQLLDMSSNQVAKLEEVYGLKKYVPQLTSLDMTNNTLCEDKSYRPTVLRKMKSLVRFDGRDVTPLEKSMFGESAGAITLAMVLEGGSAGHRFGTSDDVLVASQSDGLGLAAIQELVLERRHIRRIQSLEGLVNLRRASFADNQISHIEGLSACTALEELCLEDNRLAAVEGLQGLTRLKKLQLGKNRLTALDLMGCVTNLTQLSVEDNDLSSLAGVEQLVNLMELYAGNNRLQELREVLQLRDLPRIIILDLSGNPCTLNSGDDYRLYVIYNVRKLKERRGGAGRGGAAARAVPCGLIPWLVQVLDGVPIDAAEQAAAKTKYSGRLTRDFLEQKLGHRMFDHIRDLDMTGLKAREPSFSSCRSLSSYSSHFTLSSFPFLLSPVLRSLPHPPASLFVIRDVGSVFLSSCFERTLQELTLDANQLVEVSGLALLRSLVVLRLNSNRLGEECTFNSRRMIEKNAELHKVLTDPGATTGAEGEPGPAISTFELFPYLQVLQLGGNQIASISSLQLSSLASLRSLFLNNNDITRIDGLDGLTNLQELVLDRNRIRYIDPDAFLGLPRLRELRLEENGLRSLANLQLVTSLQASQQPRATAPTLNADVLLQALHVGQNRINEANDMERLSCLTNLVEVSLVNNPITRRQGYRTLLIAKCSRLYAADGQVISLEEREYAEGLLSQQQPSQSGLEVAGKVAVRMTNLDFAGLAAAVGQYSQAPVSPSPAAQNNMLGLLASNLGLEGVGLGPQTLALAASVGANLPGLGNGLGGPTQPGFGIGGVGYNAPGGMAGGAEQSGRDAWGRPISHDRRGLAIRAGAAAMVPSMQGPVNDRGSGVGSTIISSFGVPTAVGQQACGPSAGQRGGPSASPARRQGLGRPQGGYRGGA